MTKKQYVPLQTGVDTVSLSDRSKTPNTEALQGKKIRVKVCSKQLTEAFRPVKMYLQIFCNFPFQSELRIDGTVYYTCKTWNLSLVTVGNFMTSLIAGVIFTCVFTGLILMALQKPSKIISQERNLCGKTWEATAFQRSVVPLCVVVNSLALLLLCCVYYFPYGYDFEFYYNYWNRAVQIFNMDVTYHVRRYAIIGNVAFTTIMGCYFVMFVSTSIRMMQDTCACLANTFARFYIKDLYRGSKRAMTTTEFDNRRRHADVDIKNSTDVFSSEDAAFRGFKFMGLFVMILGFYGVRGFIMQFSFFCRVLRNGAYIWNERLRNYFLKEKADPEDQTRHRIDAHSLVQDHLILVQLYKMTEANFCVVLQCFCFFQIINITTLLYGLYLLTNVTDCSSFWELVDEFVLHAAHTCNDTHLKLTEIQLLIPAEADDPNANGTMISYTTNLRNTTYSFDDPDLPVMPYPFQNAIILVFLLVHCTVSLFQTTVVGAHAYEEVHSLNISFARNNPMEISAGGYFSVNKQLIIIIFLTVLIYFTTLIQFQPGVVTTQLQCKNATQSALPDAVDVFKLATEIDDI